jgi:hypothetical protein
MTPFNPNTDLKADLGAGGVTAKVTCLACCMVVFDVPEKSTDSVRIREGKALAAHLELSHGMVSFYGRCNDKTCTKFHLKAFEKGKVPPGVEGLRNQLL